MASLRAGAARTLITPPLGLKTMGFASRVGLIESIESDLTVSALVLADGREKIAIIAIDLCMSPQHVVSELRGRVADAIGTQPTHVMLNYNHTHSAPAFPGWLPEPPEQDALLQAYDGEGRTFMKYEVLHGAFHDVPAKFLMAEMARLYPRLKGRLERSASGMENEVPFARA